MGTLYDLVESDLMSYKVNFILSPELWDKFDLEGIDVDYSKWDRAKMIGDDGGISSETNRIPKDCGGIYVYTIVSSIIPNGGNYLMYIGKATKTETENLRARVRSYKKQFGDKYNRSKLHSLFTKWGDYVYVYYLPMSSTSKDITELEDRLIAAYGRPPCNKEILIKTVKDAVDAAF
ncbi:MULTISPECIES: GIY-YIG nuclease family protein [unclassified Roseburia]|jgi:hypothetical protein|uniref:GIY-YIG nuclease family protein n=1 Tax=unclassified Roseburia TaxID=2637578 RepID=UPI000E53211A|nr:MULTISPECIES: GIY-YIG nuclease family protein [unclassified Roseburia]RGI47114.1 hypothetical protein DXB39_10355 [Roseburia sp. OM03-7AC]RGI49569.1 hypothetical protein DXB35_09690 [Roseburia sp. OM03-18]